MNKKGFTLIELLAVIIILAVIALIATPIALDVIENARRETNKNSVYGILDSSKLYYVETMLSDDQSKIDGKTNLINELDLSGRKPDRGEVYINNSGQISVAIVYDKICYIKEFQSNDLSELDDIDNCSLNIEFDTSNLTSMVSYEFPLETAVTESRKLKVLVIDIDPVMTKGVVNDKSCVGITASQCLGQNKEQVVNELITDIEYSSNGAIDVEIVKYDYVNEFATHKSKATLLNGTKSNKLDEDTWLEIMKNGWYGFWDNSITKEFESYSLDYQYLIDKLDLVNRRNNNEFDEVWLVNVDPIMLYESIMVGRTAYWINGKELIADCENFKFMNVSIARPDTNYECNGHATENIMNNVFSVNNFSYDSNYLSIDSSNYDNLNLWQKFTLVEHANKKKNTGLSGVGNVHYSPNSESDYNWNNFTNSVYSKWREWLNYPNLTSDAATEVFDPNVYLNETLEGTNSDARKHHRWWFSLMPHMTGYTTDGYSNNWWDYIFTGDFITSVSSSKTEYKYVVGYTVDNIEVINNYKSGKNETLKLETYQKNMSFSNKNIFHIDSNGKIIATRKGSSTLTYYRDGKSIQINITVE